MIPSGKKNLFYFIILVLLWVISALIINPIGEFPLNDDWAYAKSVFILCQKGEIYFGNWPAMTLIAQILYGAAFCKIFGLSFTVLRISVLLLGLAGIIAFYFLSLKFTRNSLFSFISSALIGFNPLYFSLCYTFMTDVPFIVCLVFSTFFYYR